MLTFDVFDTMAATMSVPPVLPLCVKAMPMPMPHNMPPIIRGAV